MKHRDFLIRAGAAALTLGTLALAGCAPHASVQTAPAAAAPSAADFPTAAPMPGPAPSLTLPAPVTRTLANGLTVTYVKHGALPLVHATLLTRGGMADDPARLPGLAAFAAEMIDEGADGRSALELAAALDLLGASLYTGAGWDATQVDLEVLEPRLAEALALMADVVIRPDFPEAEIRRVRDERLTDLARAKDEARIIAANAYAALVYGGDHPYGRTATTTALKSMDRKALVEFHRAYYRPSASTLLLVGDVDPDALQPLVERAFGGWQGGALEPAVAPEAPAPHATALFLIDKPGAAQSEIRIGHPGVSRDSPDYYPLVVLNTLLGGSFTSRLNMNLRETHGYAYGASSSFAMRLGAGPFTAASAVQTAKTDSAVVEFFHELNRIRDEPIPGDELERAKRYVALGLPRRFETVGGVASQLADLALYRLPLDYYGDYVARVMTVTAEDVHRVAREYVRPQGATVVVVGDRSKIEPGLRALGIAPVTVRRAEEFVR